MAKPQSFKKNDPRINRNGRPKAEWTWSGVLRQAMEKQIDAKQVKELVSEALMDKALQGDVQAIKEIGNRIDGMPKQTTDITSGGEPLVIIKSND